MPSIPTPAAVFTPPQQQRRTLPIETVPHLIVPQPHGDVVITVETITPEIAETWLERYNTHNRSKGDERVAAMCRDMEGGNWLFVADAVRFATRADGTVFLIDGQHRLDAIVKSGEPQTFVVVHGLQPEAQEVVDTGRMRSFSDDLRMQEGITDESFVGTVTRRLLLWDRGVLVGASGSSGAAVGAARADRQTTKSELRAYFTAHRDEIIESMKVKKALTTNGFTVPASVVATAWVLLSRVDHLGADIFIVEQLIKLLGEPANNEDHPARRLRERLTRTDRWKPSSGEAFLLILHAWNHWRDGNNLGRLLPPKTWPKPSEFRIK